MNSDVEARPYIPDIGVETYLRRGSSPACENGLRWNLPCPIQLVGERAPTLSLYFARSHATTHHRSDLRTAYVSPTHLTCSKCERFCAAGAKNSLTISTVLSSRIVIHVTANRRRAAIVGVMDTEQEHPAPICPHCRKSMRLALTILSSGTLPQLHNYYCKECGVMVLRRTEWRRAA
jgi:hypothetical protein